MNTKKAVSQSKLFLESEGNAWLERSEKINSSAKYVIGNDREILAKWCSTRKDSISNILEIGAGNGYPLAFLANELDASAIGIEPSLNAVNLWEKKKLEIKGGNQTSLQVGIASNLPFKDDSFDLVVFGFCLSWIERQSLFKSISEADRVLRDGGLLAIIDFDPSGSYSNPYMHKEGLKTYKTNHSDIFLASNHYTLMYKHSFSHGGSSFHEKIDERIAVSLLFKQESDVYQKYINK